MPTPNYMVNSPKNVETFGKLGIQYSPCFLSFSQNVSVTTVPRSYISHFVVPYMPVFSSMTTLTFHDLLPLTHAYDIHMLTISHVYDFHMLTVFTCFSFTYFVRLPCTIKASL